MMESKRVKEKFFFPIKAMAKAAAGSVADLADESIARSGTRTKQEQKGGRKIPGASIGIVPVILGELYTILEEEKIP